MSLLPRCPSHMRPDFPSPCYLTAPCRPPKPGEGVGEVQEAFGGEACLSCEEAEAEEEDAVEGPTSRGARQMGKLCSKLWNSNSRPPYSSFGFNTSTRSKTK